jgi:hypothetical protein
VSHRVEFGGGAQVQYHSLPEDAREALIERAVELADLPWDAAVRPPGADTRFRETVLGSGNGLLGFYIDEARPADPRLRHRLDRIAKRSVPSAKTSTVERVTRIELALSAWESDSPLCQANARHLDPWQ